MIKLGDRVKIWHPDRSEIIIVEVKAVDEETFGFSTPDDDSKFGNKFGYIDEIIEVVENDFS